MNQGVHAYIGRVPVLVESWEFHQELTSNPTKSKYGGKICIFLRRSDKFYDWHSINNTEYNNECTSVAHQLMQIYSRRKGVPHDALPLPAKGNKRGKTISWPKMLWNVYFIASGP